MLPLDSKYRREAWVLTLVRHNRPLLVHLMHATCSNRFLVLWRETYRWKFRSEQCAGQTLLHLDLRHPT